MLVWVVLWDGGMRDICTSRENAIIAAKNFLTAELEDTFVNIGDVAGLACINGYHHTVIIYERETDTWV